MTTPHFSLDEPNERGEWVIVLKDTSPLTNYDYGHLEINEDVERWLMKNTPNYRTRDVEAWEWHVCFERKEDAALFKLFWL